MPDPALVLLMQHLTRTPPAIVRSASNDHDAHSPAAFLQHAVEQERRYEKYRQHGSNLRAEIWSRLENGNLDIELSRLDEIIEQDDHNAIEEANYVRKFENETLQNDRMLADDATKAVILAAHRKLRATFRGIYEEGRDFGLFLRALRAELSEVRSNAHFTTSDPKALRAFLSKA